MPKIPRLFPKLLPLVVLAGLAVAPPALASHSQANYFEASSVLLNPGTRPVAIAQMQHLGVKAIRVELSWADVAPGATKAARPSFDATDPSSYAWGEYDAAINEAVRLHWQVLLTVTSPVPRWATSNRKAPYITRPNARSFQEFMTAVGRHYGAKVALFSIWNEPNHPAFLLPQWNKNGTPASPRIYRGLFQAAYTGLQAAGIATPRVLFGETAPTGFDTVNVRREGSRALLHDVAPLLFLRNALCLSPSYRKAGSCGPLAIAGYAHHAYTLPVGPNYVPPMRDDVMIGVLSRLSRALDLAAGAHAIPAHTPIYLTEFGVQSKPNRQLGVPVAVQAEFDAIAEHIAWANSRVAAFSQYLLRDDPLGGAPGASVHGGTVGFQTGLEYVNGKPKPLYAAWPVPLTVSRGGGGFSLWGLVRPALGPTKVTILVRPRGSNRYRTLKNVTTNASGYWSMRSSVSGQLWRVRWTSPEGTVYQGPPVQAR
jgi:hypothetical protein